ncbi:MAG: Hpt domain-containing protein [Candidatus Limivicinus sp.]
MTIQECYQRLDGNFANVETRLHSVGLITKFITKFLNDGSFSELCQAMQNGQREEAFRAAHTLKGVCANLGFTRLGASAGQLTELLRAESNGVPEGAALVFNEVNNDYALTVNAIRAYLGSDEQA